MTVVPLWQTHRSKLNHDWLKNSYLIALARWLRVLNGEVEDPVFAREFLTTVFPVWERRRKDLARLLDEFESEMSPAQLFTRPPLAGCTAGTREWLEPLVRTLWLSRCRVRQLVVDGFLNLKSADLLYDRLARRLQQLKASGELTAEGVKRHGLVAGFDAFSAACEAVGAAVGKFPNRIRVP